MQVSKDFKTIRSAIKVAAVDYSNSELGTGTVDLNEARNEYQAALAAWNTGPLPHLYGVMWMDLFTPKCFSGVYKSGKGASRLTLGDLPRIEDTVWIEQLFEPLHPPDSRAVLGRQEGTLGQPDTVLPGDRAPHGQSVLDEPAGQL